MRYLVLINLVLITSCSSFYKTLTPIEGDQTCLSKFKPKFSSDWYDAVVDVKDHHISGLLLFKTMPDSSLRVAFTSKTGLKFFDFEFKPNGDFRVYYVIEQLNKKIIINALRKDFDIMIMKSLQNPSIKSYTDNTYIWYSASNPVKGTDYYVTSKDCSELIKVENAGRKKALEARFSNFAGSIPGKIHMKHFTFDMEINLTKITTDAIK